jgi:hypothetical protein
MTAQIMIAISMMMIDNPLRGFLLRLPLNSGSSLFALLFFPNANVGLPSYKNGSICNISEKNCSDSVWLPLQAITF